MLKVTATINKTIFVF